MRKKQPPDRPLGTSETIKKPLWKATSLAIAAAVVLGVYGSEAQALALGRVTVQSALGEPLRADIDIPQIYAEEAASLRATIASPDAFRAAGLEYSPAISSASITLQRRPDGRYFLRLSSDRAINDPFIDLILEANWSSGRIVRDYTMLFDPPNQRQSTPPLSVAAQVASPPAAIPAARPAPVIVAPAAPSSPVARPAPAVRTAPAARTTPAPAPVSRAAAPTPPADGKRVTVKAGDTASRIAGTYKPATISLDQMLVALLNANPDAFVGGNVNRLRAGVVLEVPTAEQAAATGEAAASQAVIAQSRDFNEFRRRLAEGVPTTQLATPNRAASGKVTAQVEEKKPTATTPDKLTLSKGAIQDKAAADKVASNRAAQDAATRVAELNKNINDLAKLGTASATSPAASSPSPAVTLPTGAVAPAAGAPASAATTSAGVNPASSPAPSVVAAVAPATSVAPTPTASAPKKAAVPPAPPPETSLVDDMLENPIVPAAFGGLLALLLGFVFWRTRQRKKSTQVDSSFLESRLQPDSFFGASGGQRIDTAEGQPTGSSMVYSPSQLDAAGDVDPVAEADVYLAYGRDLQAEEILKEALRTNPDRVTIHAKLLEIYSKRRDVKAFEQVAADAFALTRGEGPEWEHICELGQELDANNPLYRPGGQPAADSAGALPGAAALAAAAAATTAMPAYEMATQAIHTQDPPNSDLDLDLDFSLGDDDGMPMNPPGMSANSPLTIPVPLASEPTVAFNAAPAKDDSPLDMDFGNATVAMHSPGTLPTFTVDATPPVRLDAPDLTLSEGSLDFDAMPTALPAPPAPAASPAADLPAESGMIEFDLGALSLDLDTPETPVTLPETAGVPLAPIDAMDDVLDLGGDAFEDSSSDPLATKLALAEEFNAIGDPDGARSLAEEVVAEASGDLKSRAQKFLAEIG